MSAPGPIRLTAVLTHPVQYFAPWFRYIAAHRPEFDLTVLYAAIPEPTQQGVGFGQSFSWDVPLAEGYRSVVCAGAAGKVFDSSHFFGLDVPDIEARIAATRPDVVLLPGWHSVMQVRALRACRRLGIPVLYRGDSTLTSGPRRYVRLLWRLKTRIMLRRFDGFLAVGTSAREYLRDFDVPEPLILDSPHCVDNARFAEESDAVRQSGDRQRLRSAFGASDRDFVVAFVGKFVDRKQPLAAVRAVAGLGPSAILLMAGDGGFADAARAEATRLGVRLAWRGFLNQSALPAFFAIADCLLVPSTWESWGLVVNEAMASGLPCVATNRVEAARDLIVEGETGYVVDPGDVSTMTARLADVQRARDGGYDFMAACRARVGRSGVAAAADGLLAASRRVLAHARPPAGDQGMPRVIALCTDMVSVFGRERMTFEVLRALRERGSAVHCIVNTWESSRIVSLAEETGATWSLGARGYPLRRRGWTLRHAWLVGRDIAGASIGLIRDARRLRATHILSSGFAPALHTWPALALLRLIAGIPVILRLDNAPEPGRFYVRLWRRVISPVVDLFVANSHFTEHELASTGVPERKIRTIYNIVPWRPSAGASAPVKDSRRVIYVGQLIPPKGVDVLLDAVGVLVKKGLDMSLDVVGDIDGWEPPGWAGHRARLRARAEQPDLMGRVRFLGVRDDVPRLMASASVHCCPSQPAQREAFGVVTVEAKTAGIPSVVTPFGALPELVTHMKDGWICRDGSSASIAEGLEYFLTDEDRVRSAGAAAFASMASFSRGAFVNAWLKCFEVESGPMIGNAADNTVMDGHVH